MNYDAEWNSEWPTESGYYWFFGHRCRHAQEKNNSTPEMILVRSKRAGTDLLFIADGGFFWQSEVGSGLWTPALLPNPPKDLP